MHQPPRYAPRFPPLRLVQHLPSDNSSAPVSLIARAGVGQPLTEAVLWASHQRRTSKCLTGNATQMKSRSRPSISGSAERRRPTWSLSQKKPLRKPLFHISGEVFEPAQGSHIDLHMLAVFFHDW